MICPVAHSLEKGSAWVKTRSLWRQPFLLRGHLRGPWESPALLTVPPPQTPSSFLLFVTSLVSARGADGGAGNGEQARAGQEPSLDPFRCQVWPSCDPHCPSFSSTVRSLVPPEFATCSSALGKPLLQSGPQFPHPSGEGTRGLSRPLAQCWFSLLCQPPPPPPRVSRERGRLESSAR